jgi:hypothetical protein
MTDDAVHPWSEVIARATANAAPGADPTEETSLLTQVPEWFTETATTTVTAALIGFLFFPVKWFAGAISKARQENVTAYREARRALRAVQLERRFPLGGNSTAEDARHRAATEQRAWDDAQHLLAGARCKRLHEYITKLADLDSRSGVVDIWGDPGHTDLTPELLALAIDALNFRAKHPWPIRQRRSKKQLAELESGITSAEQEYEERWKANRAAYLEWISKEGAEPDKA